ncbi:MAG: HD domain-containing protein [Flavobacteriales bacterium]|nr:HD domain-containing protein [Flavobacteriales bacterium]
MNLSEHIHLSAIKVVSETASEANIEAYIVGGFVRDILLKRPSKDIDIVVLGSGIKLAELVAKKLKTIVNVFKNFGTAQLRIDDWEIEFVGARKESYDRGSRKPIVEDGTLQEDQERRDFTINAMSISLQKDNFGELIDPFNGLKDLENKILKTPLEPSKTYSDDPLRMMRAIRFASQLRFTIEEGSLKAITKNKERISIVSQERITDELNKIILSPIPSVGFKLLFDTELLHLIFPKMIELQGVEIIDGKGHKDNFYHTLEVLDNISKNTNSLWLRWSAILHDIAKPDTKRFDQKVGWTFHGHEDRGARMVPKIFKQLRLPLDHKMKYVQKLVRLHLRPIALVKDIVTDSGVRRLLFEAGEDVGGLLTLCRADITSKNKFKVKKYKNNFTLVEQKMKALEERDKVRNFLPPVTGELIMKTFNIKPCRAIGTIKEEIKEAILDGKIKNDSEEAHQMMLEIGKRLGLNSL